MRAYADFAITIWRGEVEQGGNRISVEASIKGMRLQVEDASLLDAQIEHLVNEAHTIRSFETYAKLGDSLGEAMFPGDVGKNFRAFLQAASSRGEGVRITLRCADAAVALWPWEYVRAAIDKPGIANFLLLDGRVSLNRRPFEGETIVDSGERTRLQILSLDGTNVRPTEPLTPDFPWQLLDTQHHVVSGGASRDSFESAIRSFTLNAHDSRLDIFHFAGHGNPATPENVGTIELSHPVDQRVDEYTGAELANQLHGAGTRLAFINACGSDDHSGDSLSVAQTVARTVGIVIGVRGKVQNLVARGFAEAFYKSIINGSTVDEAVHAGRTVLREHPADWGRVVLYSRVTSGPFVRPLAPHASASTATPGSRPAPSTFERARRWALITNDRGTWRLLPGEAGPHLRARLDDESALDVNYLHRLDASVALSSDGVVAGQVRIGQLTLAWMDRVAPALDVWSSPPFDLLELGNRATVLAVAVQHSDSVVCLVGTEGATYQVEMTPTGRSNVKRIYDSPSRCGVIVSGTMLTVREDGVLRERTLALGSYGIADVTSLDAVRSGNRVLYALIGHGHDGKEVVGWTTASGEIMLRPTLGASEIVIARRFRTAPREGDILVVAGGRVESPASGAAR